MSLYFEASSILSNEDKQAGSLKSRVFARKDLKNPATKIYALLAESLKWSPFMKDVIEKSDILRLEKKLTPALAVLLVHDLLLAKGGVATSKTNVLRVTIEKHKARLASEFTRCRIRNGFGSLEAFRAHVDGHIASSLTGDDAEANFKHPRWVRVNTLRTSTEEQRKTTLKGYRHDDNLEEILRASHKEKVFYVDKNIPDLLAFPPNHDLSKTDAYLKGLVIFQDKASCFPAFLLDPLNMGGDIIDACAAPGNKTTHLAALLGGIGKERRIFAFERNPHRTTILKKMVLKAGAEKSTTICGNTDFLTIKPDDTRFANVEALLLDPSCSGTGIVGRDDAMVMHLPEIKEPEVAGSKKRKRRAKDVPNDKMKPVMIKLDDKEADDENEASHEGKTLEERLKSLADFQHQLVQHAMHFPGARRITYSTCSVHAEENEHVVLRALASQVARERGWRLLLREEQPEGLKKWDIRGLKDACDAGDTLALADLTRSGVTTDAVAEACIRTEKGTRHGTMGFFVVAIVRKNEDVATAVLAQQKTDNDEWGGFSDVE